MVQRYNLSKWRLKEIDIFELFSVLICFILGPRPKYLEEENKTMWMIAVNFQSNKTNLVNKKETFRIKYLGILSLELSKFCNKYFTKLQNNNQPSPTIMIDDPVNGNEDNLKSDFSLYFDML